MSEFRCYSELPIQSLQSDGLASIMKTIDQSKTKWRPNRRIIKLNGHNRRHSDNQLCASEEPMDLESDFEVRNMGSTTITLGLYVDHAYWMNRGSEHTQKWLLQTYVIAPEESVKIEGFTREKPICRGFSPKSILYWS